MIQYPNAPNAQKEANRLTLRAQPNQRLVRAFDLENSFTTTDEHVHKRFLRLLVKSINAVGKGNQACVHKWTDLFSFADTSLELTTIWQLNQQLGSTVRLAPTIRMFCLATVIELLYPSAHAKPLEPDDLFAVTTVINKLWIQSKSGNLEDISVKDRRDLHDALGRLLPFAEATRLDIRPLSLIMPAYETLWRITLLTYVQVAFRRYPDSSACVMTMDKTRDIMTNGVAGSLGEDNEEERAVLVIIKASRLYHLPLLPGFSSSRDPGNRTGPGAVGSGSQAEWLELVRSETDILMWCLTGSPPPLSAHEEDLQAWVRV
jgi:hypothetical protein